MARIGKYECYREYTKKPKMKRGASRTRKRANKLQLEPLEASSESSKRQEAGYIVRIPAVKER